MAGLIQVDIEPRHEPVELWMDEPGRFSIRFRIINMSPFCVELDRAVVMAVIGDTRLETKYIHKVDFAAGQIATLKIEGKLSSEESAQINRRFDESRLGNVTFTGYFNSRLHSFSIASRDLSGVRAKLVNRPPLESADA